MQIYIYGGSNSLVKTGWTAPFASKLPAGKVTNRSIGATTTLTALYRMVTDREDEPQPGDLVIWEYALNEANHIAKGFKTEVALANGERFLRECGRRGLRVLPLILTPQAEEMAETRSPYFDKLGQVLAHYGVAGLDVSRVWRQTHNAAKMPKAMFRDNAHFNEDTGLQPWISEQVLAAIPLASVPLPVSGLRCGAGTLHFEGPRQGEWFRNSRISVLVAPPDCSLQIAGTGQILGIVSMIHPRSHSAMTVDLFKRGAATGRIVLSTGGIPTLTIPILKVYSVESALPTPWQVETGDRLDIAAARTVSKLYCESNALAKMDRLDVPPPASFIGVLLESLA